MSIKRNQLDKVRTLDQDKESNSMRGILSQQILYVQRITMNMKHLLNRKQNIKALKTLKRGRGRFKKGEEEF